MQFDMSRLLELAGVPTEEGQGVLSESKQETSREAVNEDTAQDTLVETKLRSAIRQEIASILKDFKSKGGESNSSWIHGSTGQPQNSATGRVTRGFLGLGFK